MAFRSRYKYSALHKVEFGESRSRSSWRPIRLLVLLPGSFNDTLFGELHVYRLEISDTIQDEPPDRDRLAARDVSPDGRAPTDSDMLTPGYESLTYAWGAQPAIPEVSCINILERGRSFPLAVTPNLQSALRHLRYEFEARYLWIDAICINQTDESEKSEQVPIMGHIYARAMNVCVWLGEPDDTTALAYDHIKLMLDLQEFEETLRDECADAWSAVLKLMKREWFSRRWIVQEIAFSRRATVHCGHYQMDWVQLADAVTFFQSSADEVAEIFRRNRKYRPQAHYLTDLAALGASRLVAVMSKLFRRAENGSRIERLVSLESLVLNLSAFKASNPHDIIYAVLSLARDIIPSASTTAARSRWIDAIRLVTTAADQAQNANGSSNADAVGTNTPPGKQFGMNGDQTNNPRKRQLSIEDEERVKKRHLGVPQPSIPSDPLRTNDDIADDQNAREFRVKKGVIEVLRDRIASKMFRVDYKNKKFHDVCADFIKYTIRSSRSLDMLCRPWAPLSDEMPEGAADLPSWVCRLDQAPFRPRPDGNFGRANADLFVGSPDTGGSAYAASAATKPETCSFGQGGRSLYVYGFVLDEIQDLAVPAIEGNVPNEWLAMGDWKATRDEPPESFWRTLVADRDGNGHNPPFYYRRACYHAFAQRVHGGALNTERLMASEPSKIMTAYLKRVQAVVWNRRLMRTAKGQRLGLAPYRARKGDKVCILRGCSVPVILREVFEQEDVNSGVGLPLVTMTSRDSVAGHGNGNGHGNAAPQLQPPQQRKMPDGTARDPVSPLPEKNPKMKFEIAVTCRLIGEAYVHGVMDGEAFRIRDHLNLPSAEFELV